MKVRNKNGALLPLASLVTSSEEPGRQSITRHDRERSITVFANIAPHHSQSEALAMIEDWSQSLPVGYRMVLSGASATFRDSMAGFAFALLLGVVVAYMILAAQFNSLLHPLTVLSILPLSLAGAALALAVTGLSLNIFSSIGILLLLGIVKKNSILLVDFAREARKAGHDAVSALLQAGSQRLRPILMTTASTLAAALPAALSLGPGGEVRVPMAVAVIGGLFVSTLLSLFVVPALYLWIENRLD